MNAKQKLTQVNSGSFLLLKYKLLTFYTLPDNFLTSFQDLFGGLMDRLTPASNGSKEFTNTNSASPLVKYYQSLEANKNHLINRLKF